MVAYEVAWLPSSDTDSKLLVNPGCAADGNAETDYLTLSKDRPSIYVRASDRYAAVYAAGGDVDWDVRREAPDRGT